MADGFLGRWSRRKQEVREGKPLQEPAAAPAPAEGPLAAPAVSRAPAPGMHPAHGSEQVQQPAQAPAAPPAPPPAPTLQDAQALTPASDFKAFVARDVAPEVRNLAMKKLFADPHFNVMDGLDIYIGDYTQPDPLPAGMLRKMVSAHTLGFFDHEKQGEGAPGGAPSAVQPADPIAPAPTQPREDAHMAPPSDVAQSRPHTANCGEPPSEPALAAPPSPADAAAQASHTHHDHDADLRLQPDDAPRRECAGGGSA